MRCEGNYQKCYVTNINKNGNFRVRNVDFGDTGAQSFKAIIRSTAATTLEIRISNKLVGSIKIDSTNGEWQEVSCDLSTTVKGIQNYLYFYIKGSEAQTIDLDSWQFFEYTTGITQPSTLHTQHSSPYDIQGRKMNGKNNYPIKIQQGKKIITK